jgi:uncharacterized protein
LARIDSIVGIRRVLAECCTIAVVGLSAEWHRPSFFAAKYMQEKGYRIVPVNPKYKEILGEVCYPNLASIPHPVDMVDCFRKEVDLPAIALEVVAMKTLPKVLWMQLGIDSTEAADIVSAKGIDVVANRCVKIEHARLLGGLGWIGVNTKVISAKRATVVRHHRDR